MEKIDPHKTHSYSHDQLLMTAFGYEIRNVIRLSDSSNELVMIEAYLQKRIDEIKERWK